MLVEPATIALPGDEMSMLDSALMYGALDMPPVPIHGLRADSTCCCGNLECPTKNRGKHPVGKDWQKRATCDIDEIRERFAGHRGNIGIALAPKNLILIDADGKEGLGIVASWGLPATLTQRSGRGDDGAHFIFRLASHHDPHTITDRRVAPGVDVKVRGQFVAAPSRHVSGNLYTWVLPIPIVTLPDFGYELVRTAIKPAPAYVPLDPSENVGDLYERASKYLDAVPHAIEGAGGHKQTFAAARVLIGWLQKGISESRCWDLFLQYNQRCQPPWSEKDLRHKWEDAKKSSHIPRYEDRPRLYVVPQNGAPALPLAPPSSRPPPPVEIDWRSELLFEHSRTGKARIVSDCGNVVRILQLEPSWKGRIRYDSFSGRIMLQDPPWDAYQRPTMASNEWTDEDSTRLSGWLRRRFNNDKFCPSIVDCDRAVPVVAHANAFHPVRDYLDGLQWDGTARLRNWLTTYLGAPDDEYARMVGSWWLIGAVARIQDPGCKMDYVPILEGVQGIRKSTALRVLAGSQWFSDTPIDLNSKDAYSAIQGRWFVELAELDSLVRVDATRAKAFFSSPCDRFRRAYARTETEQRRQCVFVGTTNESEYLSDHTGARRFWPIRCLAVDICRLEADRDQLWAEATHEYRDGRLWFPETSPEHSILAEPQADRSIEDAWETAIRDYLTPPSRKVTSTSELLGAALGIEKRDWTRAAQVRVGIIVRSKLRWAKRRVCGVGWVYERPVEAGQFLAYKP